MVLEKMYYTLYTETIHHQRLNHGLIVNQAFQLPCTTLRVIKEREEREELRKILGWM